MVYMAEHDEALRSTQRNIPDLMQAIALEQTAMAKLIAAETDKFSGLAGTLSNVEDLHRHGDHVRELLKLIIKKEILIEFHLDWIREMVH